MKKLFRKNQIIITALVIMVAVAGYLSLSDENESILTVNDTTNPTKEALTATDISSADIETAEQGEEESLNVDTKAGTTTAAVTSEATETGKENAGEAVMVNSTVSSEYFESAKLAREQTRASNKETLMELVNNQNTTEQQKQKAMNQIVAMTDAAEKETQAETLLEAKGFENAVVSIVDDSVDVIVDATELTNQQIAQIEDVVKRKVEVTSDKIVISPVGKKE